MRNWKKYGWRAVGAVVAILLAGCLWGTPNPGTLPDTIPLDKQAEGLKGTGRDIGNKADEIKQTASEGEKKAALPEFGRIKQSADDIKGHVKTLDEQADEVANAQAQIIALESRIADLEAELDEASAGTKALEDKMWLVFMGLGALAILAAGPLVYCGKIGAAVVVGGTGFLAVGIGKFMADWAWLPAMGVGVVLLGLVAYLAWTVFTHRRQLVEVVRSSEVMKQHIPQWATPDGPDVQKEVDRVQSADTRKAVRKIRLEDNLTDRVGVAA